MNHFALYIKVMNRSIPVQVLSVLEIGSPHVYHASNGVLLCHIFMC